MSNAKDPEPAPSQKIRRFELFLKSWRKTAGTTRHDEMTDTAVKDVVWNMLMEIAEITGTSKNKIDRLCDQYL